MLSGDAVLLIVVYAQPFILGALMFIAARPKLLMYVLNLRNFGTRRRLRSTRFFECAAYPRLTGWLRYSTQGLALCAVFLLYDLDLVFFLSEMSQFEAWTWTQVILVLAYLIFFLGGLYYDLWRYSLLWAY